MAVVLNIAARAFAGGELAFDIRQVFKLAGSELKLSAQVTLLLAQGIQLAVGALLKLAVTPALIRQRQLRGLAVAPGFVQGTHMRRNAACGSAKRGEIAATLGGRNARVRQ